MEQILPVIDTAVLQEKANEYAMEGALKVIKDFYTGYDSPYKKAIEADLTGKGVEGYRMGLPDILAVLNESLSAEIDRIANNAVAKSFVPLVAKFLTRQEKEVNLSDILRQFIETAKAFDGPDRDDYDLSLDRNEGHGWYSMRISDGSRSYDMTLHENWDDRGKPLGERKYSILSLPNDSNAYKHSMRLSGDGYTLELPFTRDVLKDDFLSYVAGLLIAGSNITIDVNYFDDRFFSDDDHCHCH